MFFSSRSLAAGLLLVGSEAFAPAINQHQRQLVSPLSAAEGAPQYDKFDGVLREAEKVAEGSFMLHVEATGEPGVKLEYQPGHVLALEIEDASGDLNDDAKKNGGWMRGPYTVSRSTETSLDVLVRVVGKKSKTFSESKPGIPVRFGGKFHVPILEGINKEETKKVVMISTGVGVGPCVGAIELALQDETFPPIALFASYRESNDVAYREHLSNLSSKHNSRFEWQPIVTSEMGRLSSSEENLKVVSDCIQGLGIEESHFHLIGNAQMVKEWKEGLEEAGVPAERVTIEQYFNHKAETDKSAIENIAAAVLTATAVEA